MDSKLRRGLTGDAAALARPKGQLPSEADRTWTGRRPTHTGPLTHL
jgi:hypothetical protein